MIHLHPIHSRQNKLIAKSVERASGVVATTVRDLLFEQKTDIIDVPIGRKPEMIGTARFEACVGSEAVRKLGILGIHNFEYNEELTDQASRCRAEGYGNAATDYNRRNLVIVMTQCILPESVIALGGDAPLHMAA